MPSSRQTFIEALSRSTEPARETLLVTNGRRSRALVQGDGPITIVFLHGWPMTSHAWRFVQPALAAKGFRTLAIDLPGLGGSDPASTSYDTVSIARDVLAAVDTLGLERFVLVGHDIGGMVAVSLTLSAPLRVSALCCVETTAPGVGTWEEARKDPRRWHFHFHATPDLPEKLIGGRERAYVRFFYERDGQTLDALDSATLDIYANAYADPVRLRAGFDYYRAFDRSADGNRSLSAKGSLQVPVLAVGGRHSAGDKVARNLSTIASNVTELVVDCGHFVPEEAPQVLAPALEKLTATYRQ